MKPSLPQGTRDFTSTVIYKREYILNIIRTQFILFGFEPLETPAFENMDTLLGKYGEEGDKLIFKILNNGLERVEKHQQANEDFQKVLAGKNEKGITERALKYDLTIPFARFVAMNHTQLLLPYKRYQIQQVWRADRPQRGRYREFTQCDADVIGSKELLNEIELIQLYLNVFQQLHIDIEIAINNRKILLGLAEICGGAQHLTDITVAIDKLDKTSVEKVTEELQSKKIADISIQKILTYLSFTKNNFSNDEMITHLKEFFKENETAQLGIKELEILIAHFKNIKIDVSLARGLHYYTGTIIEAKPLHIQMGSLGGGGRYDDLTGLFGLNNMTGVGISFGVDRIYDVMEELNLFPENINKHTDVMLINFGEIFLNKNIEMLNHLRAHQISCELYHEPIKFDKQLKYANKKNVSFIILIGEEELKENKISIKNFQTGEQQKISFEQLIETIKKH